MDPATLAPTAIATALPYLAKFGQEVAKSVAGSAGKSIWDWVKSKLTSDAGREAVEDLEQRPDDSDNQKAVEAALAKILKSDAAARSGLDGVDRNRRSKRPGDR
jgi:hypothetical protein